MKSIFSKIIDREIPCHLVAENEFAIAFMDINPVSKGHVLVVPKKEIDYLFDLDEDTYFELWKFAKIIQAALLKTTSCLRVGVSVVGFEVPHAHIHLIPINNLVDMDFNKRVNFNSSELSDLAIKISNNISN
tara:strand:- start:382 stop:777 length:396 start_codon:yes stop_codon:yes gene_type:complete